MKLAPVILFAYNRPEHTLKTLLSLKQNRLSDQSVLFIYCDGPKEGASDEELATIRQVRDSVRQQMWCKEVVIAESDVNKGLAGSVIQGVTEVVNEHGKVIVLEDDLVTSPGFLQYMNDALDTYENEEQVMHVSGYMFPVSRPLPSTFFYNTASCWGWGTWARAWRHFRRDSEALMEEIIQSGRLQEFTLNGTANFQRQLQQNIDGTINTWAVKWYASFFLKNGHALHPYPSLVQNIGHDGSGENCNNSSRYQWRNLAGSVPVKRIEIQESREARDLMQQFYSNPNVRLPRKGKAQRLISVLKAVTPERYKKKLRALLQGDKAGASGMIKPFEYLKQLPRYEPTQVDLFGKSIRIVDGASFVSIYREVFEHEIYRFRSDRDHPRIIDGGANIGLSVIYFKQLYPGSEIMAFEPDPVVFNVLQHNLKVFELDKVTTLQKGLWNEETTLQFFSEGADAGRIALSGDRGNEEIRTLRLRDFLQQPVDFLKLDIEGAETRVIEDCADLLQNVNNLFIEYHSFTDRPQELDKLLAVLARSNFRYYLHNNNHQVFSPFMERREHLGMDNLLNIFAYRQFFK